MKMKLICRGSIYQMIINYNSMLCNSCRWNDNQGVIVLLNKNLNIDLTYSDGIYFRLALKYQNVDMLNTLLDYYEKTAMAGGYDSTEYQTAKHKLQDILEDAIKSYDTSEEIQKVLNKYIAEDSDYSSEYDSEDFENDIEDFNLSSSQSTTEVVNSGDYLTLTEENLKHHDTQLGGEVDLF